MKLGNHRVATMLACCACAFFGTAKSFATATVSTPANASVSADTSAGTFVTLTGPALTEGANQDIKTGTIVLNAPAGFQFNPAASVTATVSRVAGTGTSLLLNSGTAVVTASSITITVQALDASGSTRSRITWSGIQARAVAGTPLASGSITRAGTATITGITTSTSFGLLTEVGGTVKSLAFTTQPGGAVAGAKFGTQPVVKSDDQFGNPATNGLPANSYVALSPTGGSGPLQGTTSVNLGMSAGKGTATYTGLQINVAGNNKQLTASSTNGLASGLSSVFTVSPAAASKLVIATQPSATATAGVAFAQQPVIYIEDTYNNICTSSNSAVTATRSAGAGTLLGTTNLAAAAGVAVFSNLAHSYATNITIRFTSAALTATNSSAIAVSPNSYSQLVVLAPGQTNAPGTASGMGGTATAQTAGTAFTVKVLASDAYGNLINTVTDLIGITSSDLTAVLPVNAALSNGTNSFAVTLKGPGSQTVTASDITTGSQTGSSSAITVKAAAFAKLQLLMPGETAAPGTPTGKTGTPNAQTAGASYTVTVNAVDANWNLISTNDTVHLTSSDAQASLPANTALSGGSVSLTLTNKTAGSQTVTASDTTNAGISPNTGTATVINPAAASKLVIATQPSATAVAGVVFAQQPVITVQDPYSNLCNTNSTVTASRSAGAGTLLGTTSIAAVGGVATYTNLAHGWATNITIQFASPGLPSTNSGTIAVSSGPYSQLVVLAPGQTNAPGTASGVGGTATAQAAGKAFAVEVMAADGNGNLVNAVTDTVGITSSDSKAVLPGNAALSGGTQTFSVTFETTGSQIVTANDLTTLNQTGASSLITVNSSPFAQLQVLMPGETAAPGTPTGKTGTPTAQTAGTSFRVTVNAVDANWNVINTNDTVHLTSSDGQATLPANTALSGGSVSLTLTNKTAGGQTLTASDITQPAIVSNTGSAYSVVPAALAKLQVLVPGETAAPGSATGKTGTPTAQVAGTAFNVTVNSVDANWNLVNANDTIQITSSDGNATLPPNAELVGGTRTFGVTLQTPGSSTVTASDLTDASITASTSPQISVGNVAPASQATPVVAIHDSELTRALESIPASGATPTGPGTTGFQWWPTNWHYFVMPDSVKEALRSDGTAFTVVGDSNILSGVLTNANGSPKYPIVISLASEAVQDSEVAQLTNYVAGGGFLLVGSSAFTRNTNGTTRGNFALASAMGINMVFPSLTNWSDDLTLTKVSNHPILSMLPSGQIQWQMPSSSEEISWPVYTRFTGEDPDATAPGLPHLVWQVQANGATVIAQGDGNAPYLLVRPYGKGYFIYDAAMQPLIGHGGWAPGMYAYSIFRNAIQWAFQAAGLPVVKRSPWPYPYDAAVIFRHDMEAIPVNIIGIEDSALYEQSNGVSGDYYFCTGVLREDMLNPTLTNTIASLQRAITNAGATLRSHNGGLTNINTYYNPPLVEIEKDISQLISEGWYTALEPYTDPVLAPFPSDGLEYDYWHWSPDEILGQTSLPSGYASASAYALTSISNSFVDLAGWGLTSGGPRAWVAPYFNATREGSFQIEDQLGIKITGDTKLSPFPHWTLSTQTPDKLYSTLQLPVSDWFVSYQDVIQIAQAMEAGHTTATVQALVDAFYNMGALINLYCHSTSPSGGPAGSLPGEYLTYSLSKPRVWTTNAAGIYTWWLQQSNAQVTVNYTNSSGRSVTTLSITGEGNTNAAVEILAPSTSYSALQVFANGTLAGTNVYRTNGQVIKVLVGTTVSNAVISYLIPPSAHDDVFTVQQGSSLGVSAPGVLTNDTGGSLIATLVSGPANGSLTLNSDGSFTYTPTKTFTGSDGFTYQAVSGSLTSSVATVIIMVLSPG
ncbi:MAG: Ig-like domain-containing protein, partial [Limisphaerales bacterium]